MAPFYRRPRAFSAKQRGKEGGGRPLAGKRHDRAPAATHMGARAPRQLLGWRAAQAGGVALGAAARRGGPDAEVYGRHAARAGAL
jgi:hypothetical protein